MRAVPHAPLIDMITRARPNFMKIAKLDRLRPPPFWGEIPKLCDDHIGERIAVGLDRLLCT